MARGLWVLFVVVSMVAVDGATVPLFCGQNLASGQGVAPPAGVAGYTVTLEESWPECRQGMYPVRITIETNPPLAAVNDERFTVSLSYREYMSSQYVVSAPVVIRAGSTSAVTELYVPAVRSNDIYGNELLVEKGGYDGRFGRGDLLTTNLIQRDTYYGDEQPSVLFVSSSDPNSRQPSRKWTSFNNKTKELQPASTQGAKASTVAIPSFDQRLALFEVGDGTGVSNQALARMSIDGISTVHEILPERLPINWLGLTGIDQILMSMSDFKAICFTNELQRGNLEKWVAAGGRLVVFDTGPDFREADKVWELLLGEKRGAIAKRQRLKWSVPGDDVRELLKLFASDPLNHVSSDPYSYRDETIWYSDLLATEVAGDLGAWAEFEEPSACPSGTRFAISDYLNGSITVVSDNMSQWDVEDWRFLENAMAILGEPIPDRIGGRTGIESMSRFGIPGVGAPPILMFQILIGLFLIIAGPVILIVLKRLEQLQFLFVVVPLMSAAVCLSLFLFAVFVDGTKQWGRAQTVTTIDHRTQMAVTQARTAFYSGSSPGPYSFPADALVMMASYGTTGEDFHEYGNGILTVSGGNIRSRTPHELTTLRSRVVKSEERLIFKSGETDSEGNVSDPFVENRLGADVDFAIFKDGEGKLFFVADLRNGETVIARTDSELTLRTMLRNVVSRLCPGDVASPYAPQMGDDGFWSEDYQDLGDEDRVIQSLRKTELKVLMPHPQSYVAILETLPLVADQLEPVHYKLQIHVVLGQW